MPHSSRLSHLAGLARRHINGLYDALWDAFAPPLCAGCGLELEQTGACFCPPCERLADVLRSPVCPTCLEPRPGRTGRRPRGIDLECRRCRDAPPAFDALEARWLYRDTISDALLAVKYGRQLWRLHRLAEETRRWATDVIAPIEEDVAICPVPMSNPDLRRRGFNVSSLLARWWFGRVNRQVRKVRATRPQAGLPREERLTNLDGVFGVIDPDAVRGRHWVVVDDVVTTATTARQMACVLRDAGATGVSIVALARAGRFD